MFNNSHSLLLKKGQMEFFKSIKNRTERRDKYHPITSEIRIKMNEVINSKLQGEPTTDNHKKNSQRKKQTNIFQTYCTLTIL